jgi:hypothetical protein
MRDWGCFGSGASQMGVLKFNCLLNEGFGNHVVVIMLLHLTILPFKGSHIEECMVVNVGPMI